MYFNLTPLPPEQCWVLQVKHLLIYIFCTLYGRQLCLGGGGGWGENLVEAVFMSVYRRVAVNSIQNQLKIGRCPKPFWPGL